MKANNMPKLYVLVGVPGSGKSSWVARQSWASQCSCVSTDAHVEAEAARQSKTYNEVFTDYMPHAVRLMADHVKLARDTGMDIIWDQTSTTVKSRKKKFNMLPQYHKIAVVFRTPDRKELDQRLGGRIGKNIPKRVVDSMIAGWEEPTVQEGFDEVIYVD
jgi:predicted kinase